VAKVQGEGEGPRPAGRPPTSREWNHPAIATVSVLETSIVKMPKRTLWVVSLSLVATWAIAFDDYLSAKRKFDQIEAEQFRAGSRVVLTPAELNAWVAHEVPAGIRNPKVWVSSPGIATATALIDFAKVRSGQGHEPGWMMKHLLEGEHPVTVTARIRSENGTATVDVRRFRLRPSRWMARRSIF